MCSGNLNFMEKYKQSQQQSQNIFQQNQESRLSQHRFQNGQNKFQQPNQGRNSYQSQKK